MLSMCVLCICMQTKPIYNRVDVITSSTTMHVHARPGQRCMHIYAHHIQMHTRILNVTAYMRHLCLARYAHAWFLMARKLEEYWGSEELMITCLLSDNPDITV